MDWSIKGKAMFEVFKNQKKKKQSILMDAL